MIRCAMRRLHFLYALLLFVALLALFGWIAVTKTVHPDPWISVWAPHICTAAVELLLAAAVLDRWTRGQEAAVRRPLLVAAEIGLRAALCNLGTMLLIQRTYLAALPREHVEIEDAFDTGQWRVAVRYATYTWLEGWEREMDRSCSSLTLSVGRYEDVLPPECAAAAWRMLSEWEAGAGARVRAHTAHVRLLAGRVAVDAAETRIDSDTQADVVSTIATCRDLCHAFDETGCNAVELRTGLETTLRLIDIIRRSLAHTER
jgi:hypothetical protein